MRSLQSGTHDRGSPLARPLAMHLFQLADRYGLYRFHLESALRDHALETGDRHAVQPTGGLVKLGRSVGFEIRAPCDKCIFGKNQMRPRKYAEEMASQRVIPGRPE